MLAGLYGQSGEIMVCQLRSKTVILASFLVNLAREVTYALTT